jgi:hypothetical protein
MFHILLMYGEHYQGIGASTDGMWEDPSRALGMQVAQESPDYL